MMKKGDIVTIKTFKEIEPGLNGSDVHDGLYFNREDDMMRFCGQTVKLLWKRSGIVWKVKGNTWFWSEDWLEPPPEPFLSDKDFDI